MDRRQKEDEDNWEIWITNQIFFNSLNGESIALGDLRGKGLLSLQKQKNHFI